MPPTTEPSFMSFYFGIAFLVVMIATATRMHFKPNDSHPGMFGAAIGISWPVSLLALALYWLYRKIRNASQSTTS